jgi:hypothetical protein
MDFEQQILRLVCSTQMTGRFLYGSTGSPANAVSLPVPQVTLRSPAVMKIWLFKPVR